MRQETSKQEVPGIIFGHYSQPALSNKLATPRPNHQQQPQRVYWLKSTKMSKYYCVAFVVVHATYSSRGLLCTCSGGEILLSTPTHREEGESITQIIEGAAGAATCLSKTSCHRHKQETALYTQPLSVFFMSMDGRNRPSQTVESNGIPRVLSREEEAVLFQVSLRHTRKHVNEPENEKKNRNRRFSVRLDAGC